MSLGLLPTRQLRGLDRRGRPFVLDADQRLAAKADSNSDIE